MRIVDRLLATLLALAGLVFGVLVVIEVVAALVGQPAVLLPYSAVADFFRDQSWSAGWIRLIAAAVLLAGLLLLIGELKPRRRTQLVLEAQDPHVVTTLSTRSLARLLEDSAVHTDGVHRARVRVRSRRARVLLDVPLDNATGVAAQARTHAQETLAAVGLRQSPRLDVRTRKVGA